MLPVILLRASVPFSSLWVGTSVTLTFSSYVCMRPTYCISPKHTTFPYYASSGVALFLVRCSYKTHSNKTLTIKPLLLEDAPKAPEDGRQWGLMGGNADVGQQGARGQALHDSRLCQRLCYVYLSIWSVKTYIQSLQTFMECLLCDTLGMVCFMYIISFNCQQQNTSISPL